jgi:hypothetical protein
MERRKVEGQRIEIWMVMNLVFLSLNMLEQTQDAAINHLITVEWVLTSREEAVDRRELRHKE